LYHLGQLQLWHLHAAAFVYGLLKMISLAGVPSLIPSLVPPDQLNTANAMESISYGAGSVAGPALAGLLIARMGGANVLAIDALTYYALVLALAFITPAAGAPAHAPSSRVGLGPALQFVRSAPAVWAITLMFMTVNVGTGMIAVLLPVYAREFLGGDAATYGWLVSAAAAGNFAGSVVVGSLAWPWTLGRSIAAAQLLAGLAYSSLILLPALPGAAGLLGLAELLASPLTIWAQTVRMRLIPAHLRGRVFSLLRTLMQATPPLGGAVAGALLARPEAGLAPVIVLIGLVFSVPALVGLLHPALAHENTLPTAEA
jgi:MFS family permease